MHTYIQRQNQQVNRRHIKITYLLTAPEPAQGLPFWKRQLKTETEISRINAFISPLKVMLLISQHGGDDGTATAVL